MSHESAATTLRTAFRAAWSADPGLAVVPLYFPNEQGLPPGDETAEWVLLEVTEGDTFQIAAGEDPPERQVGVIVLRIFGRLGAGDGLFRRRVDRASAIWRAFDDFSFNLGATSARRIGASANPPGWYEYQAITPFDYEPAS